MSNLTIDEALKKKGEMEDAVTRIVQNFENETGLKVSDFQVNVVHIAGREHPYTIAIVTSVVL